MHSAAAGFSALLFSQFACFSH